MFRPIKKKQQALSYEKNIEILTNGSSGVLSLQSKDGYPYGVPMSYAYEDGKLYLHGSRTGHRHDCVTFCDRASFCVIQQDQVVPEEYTTYYRSVIAFGTIRISRDDTERRHAITKIGKKYFPTDLQEHLDAVIDKEFIPMEIFVLDIEHLTGKQAAELCVKI